MRICFIFSLLLCCSGCLWQRSPDVSVETLAQREQKVRELLRLATIQLRRGDAQGLMKAEADFQLVLEIQKGDARALDGLGSVAFLRQDYERAEQFFRAAYHQRPDYDRAVEHLALVEIRRGHADRGVQLLRRAIRMNPLNHRARNNLSVQQRKGQTGVGGGLAEPLLQLYKARALLSQKEGQVYEDVGIIDQNIQGLER